MATYKGASGIRELRRDIRGKIKSLVGGFVIQATSELIENSPFITTTELGTFADTEKVLYPSKDGVGFTNYAGDFRNSWNVLLNDTAPEARTPSSGSPRTGSDSLSDAIGAAQEYNLHKTIWIRNGVDYADEVEENYNTVGATFSALPSIAERVLQSTINSADSDEAPF